MAAETDRTNRWDIVSEIPDLTGKIAIVTGANSPGGMGFHIAQHLALKGAKVYVSARSLEKALFAITTLKEQHPSLVRADLLHPLPLDLGDLKCVSAVVEEFEKKEGRLDILINNASILASPLVIDKNGISDSFATNHLGPFRLTTGLLPLLKATAKQHPGARIINISSTAHSALPDNVQLSSLEDFNQDLGGADTEQSNFARYGLSKLANILFTKEIQKRFDAEGIPAISISLHPGGVLTDGAIAYLGGTNHPLAKDSVSPSDGALTSLFAAAHPDPWVQKDRYAGVYLMPYGVIQEPSKNAQNGQLAAELWTASEKVLKDIGA